MCDKKFDPKKLNKLNNPQRLDDIPLSTLAPHLSLEDFATLVDIGAGTGFFSVAFATYFTPKKLYACDISRTMLDWVEKNISPAHQTIIPTLCVEAQTPLEDEVADLVFMICLHHELDFPEQTLAESYRILKSGGKVLIIDWKKEDMAEGPPKHIRCTTEDITNQLQNSHFKCVHIGDDLKKHFYVVAQKE